MTLVVVSLAQATPEAMIAAARRAGDAADLLEVRADRLDKLDGKVLELLARDVRRPALLTIRPKREGGSFKGSETERRDLLIHGLEIGFEYLDVEADASFADGLIAQAHRRGAHVILSRHVLDGPAPDADAILAFLKECKDRGAWCGKVAIEAKSPRDLAALVHASLEARRRGYPAAVMAVNEAALRLLAPTLGLRLVYAAIPGEPLAAPGQLPADEIASVHAALTRVRGSTKTAFILGDPVDHSLSPAFQTAAFKAAGIDAMYVPWHVAPADLPRAIQGLAAKRSLLGANVTVPHKTAILPLLDRLDASARAAGAVNTLVPTDGHLVGHNTDGAGALDALAAAGIGVEGARVLILGAGGTARGVGRAFADAGARVALTNRSPRRAEEAAQVLGVATASWRNLETLVAEADLVVNATPLGLEPGEDPLAGIPIPKSLALLDAPYRTGGTDLVRRAQKAGAKVVRGESMLLYQGARAFSLWTDLPAPLHVMRRALLAQGVEA
ncbi:MAG TPA: shikimate dehydrogenase [Candidatus Thermoplasmatota archaeon]|nr:shikimate dehydrogenase [Candidatus Thermoplasmatota archaeon]